MKRVKSKNRRSEDKEIEQKLMIRAEYQKLEKKSGR